MNVVESIQDSFSQFISKQFGDASYAQKMDFALNTDAQKSEFGDINCNIALILAKPLGKAPRDIAQEIIKNFSHPLVEKLELAGPGFLNFYLKLKAFQKLASSLFTQKDNFFKSAQSGIKYNVEFVSANPTGPLHIGHGRGGIIGDVLSNVLAFTGYDVCKEHYINDAGTQIQKLGQSLKIRCQQELGQKVELPEDGYHGEYLKELAQACIKEHGNSVIEKDDELFSQFAYTNLLALLKKTVGDYNISFDVWFSEKTLHPEKVVAAIKQLTDKGYTYEKDGALWFKSTEFGDDKDRVLKKTDGNYTYIAVDAAYLLDKAARGFNYLILVLGQDHHSFPKRLEGIRQALGLKDITLKCILYQLVSIKEGGAQVKLSKRAGRIVNLADITETVGADIARFFYLNRKADAHLDFDLDLALSKTDENPVYYLQYAYVRTCSILKKADEHKKLKTINADDTQHLTRQEALLIKKMVELKTLLNSIAKNYQVHLVAYYLLDLAHTFHNYYHHNRVIEPKTIDQSRGRLVLVVLVKQMFDRCLQLMGVSRPEKM